MFAPPTTTSGFKGLIAIDTSFGLDAFVVDILIFWNCGYRQMLKISKREKILKSFIAVGLSIS